MSDRKRWHIKDPATQDRILANLRRYACGDRRWRGRLKIPSNCPPLVRRLFEIMNEHKVSMSDVARRAGTSYEVVSHWRSTHSATMALFEAAVNSVGYELKIVRKRPNGGSP